MDTKVLSTGSPTATKLPAVMLLRDMRPLTGASTRVKLKFNSAVFNAAWLAAKLSCALRCAARNRSIYCSDTACMGSSFSARASSVLLSST